MQFQEQQAVTPKLDDKEISSFKEIHNLDAEAVYVDFKDEGYGKEWCHVASKHYAIENGGKRIHGWALWKFPQFIMGDFHSVWESPEGKLIDLTTPRFNQKKIAFIRDDTLKIKAFMGLYILHGNRTSDPNTPFYKDGNPTNDKTWELSPTNRHLKAYCENLGIQPSAIVTDQTHG